MPTSTALFNILAHCSSGIGSAKQSVPKQIGETCTPVLPKLRYSMIIPPKFKNKYFFLLISSFNPF
jgi:hypothetical protein